MSVLSTRRLRVRTWSSDDRDLDLACSLWGDPEVMTFIDRRGGLNRDQVREKLQLELSYQEKYGVQYWPVFEHSGAFVGVCGMKPWIHSPRGGHEIGFHLVKSAWGKGYAPEVAQAVVEYAFEELQLPHLMAGHHPENAGAKKILTRLGFEFLEDVLFKPTGLMHPSYRLLSRR